MTRICRWGAGTKDGTRLLIKAIKEANLGVVSMLFDLGKIQFKEKQPADDIERFFFLICFVLSSRAVIWLCSSMRYWPGRELVYVPVSIALSLPFFFPLLVLLTNSIFV